MREIDLIGCKKISYGAVCLINCPVRVGKLCGGFTKREEVEKRLGVGNAGSEKPKG